MQSSSSDTGTPRWGSRFSKGIEVAWARWTRAIVGAALRPIRSRYASRSNSARTSVFRVRRGDLLHLAQHPGLWVKDEAPDVVASGQLRTRSQARQPAAQR